MWDDLGKDIDTSSCSDEVVQHISDLELSVLFYRNELKKLQKECDKKVKKAMVRMTDYKASLAVFRDPKNWTRDSGCCEDYPMYTGPWPKYRPLRMKGKGRVINEFMED